MPRSTADYLWRITRERRAAIKQVLMNGRLVTGVGNIYASEALFRARINPRRAARRLSRADCAAPGARGARRAATPPFVPAARRCATTSVPTAIPAYFRQKLYVYERDGKPCRVCGTLDPQDHAGPALELFLSALPALSMPHASRRTSHSEGRSGHGGTDRRPPGPTDPSSRARARAVRSAGARDRASATARASRPNASSRASCAVRPRHFPLPQQVLDAARDAQLRAVGFSYAKIAALKDLAAKTIEGIVPPRVGAALLGDLEIIERLTAGARHRPLDRGNDADVSAAAA